MRTLTLPVADPAGSVVSTLSVAWRPGPGACLVEALMPSTDTSAILTGASPDAEILTSLDMAVPALPDRLSDSGEAWAD